jgi:hypothetical protein
MISLRFAAGVAMGAAGMYLADPANGRARRHRLVDRAKASRRRRRRDLQRGARFAEGRAAGERARRQGAGRFHPTDDRSIELHLHQVLAESDIDTRDVTVEVTEGHVRVRGQIATHDDLTRVVELLQREPGVQDVSPLLHLPGEPAPNKLPSRVADQPAGTRPGASGSTGGADRAAPPSRGT